MDDELYVQTLKRAAHLTGVSTHSLTDRMQGNRETATKVYEILCSASDAVMSCMKLPEKPVKTSKPKGKADVETQ